MKRALVLLYVVVFVATTGYGVTLPAMPFFVERLALGSDASQSTVALHVAFLTAAYALGQLVSSPIWGGRSDVHGRKAVLGAGLVGFAVAQIAFGLGRALPLLYGARIFGGIFSGAILTAASSYVADLLPPRLRGRGMGWLGMALSLGLVVGPATSGFLTLHNWHIVERSGHLVLDGFSIPFFAAATAALLAWPLVRIGLPDSGGLPLSKEPPPLAARPKLFGELADLLFLVLIAQGALALFESVFSIYAKQTLELDMTKAGIAFAVCGLVMAVLQGGLVAPTASRFGTRRMIGVGFLLAGLGLFGLPIARSYLAVVVVVGIVAAGFAFTMPNLTVLVANGSRSRVGAALGLQGMVSSAGQIVGPVVGGALFGMQAQMPFFVTAGVLAVAAARLRWPRHSAAEESRVGVET